MNKFITLHGLAVFWEELKTRIVQQSDLATVATTGKYSDLIGTPSIPAAYTLPTASPTTLGGVKVGSGLTISSGVLSATGSSSSYTLPTASTSVLGGVKVGNGLSITNGVLAVTSAPTATTATTATSAMKDGSGNVITTTYAPKASPTFTGTVTAPNLTVTASLAIPGGKVWVG